MPLASTSAFALAREAALSRVSASRAFSSFTVQSIWPLLVAPAVDGDVENLGGARGRYFDGPLLVERVFAQLGGPVAIEILRLAADRGLLNSGLFECGDDGVGGAGSIGIGRLGVFRLCVETNVQDGEIWFDGDRFGSGDA